MCCFPATHTQWCFSVWCSEAAGSLEEKEKPNPKPNNPLAPWLLKGKHPLHFMATEVLSLWFPLETWQNQQYRNDSEIPAIKRSFWSLLFEFARCYLTPTSQLPELLLGFGKPFTTPAFPQAPFLYILSIATSSIR